MNPHLVIVLAALLFILVTGGLSLLRREVPSVRLVVEVLALTGLSIGISIVTGASLNPIVFFIFLYLITLRCRVLIDLGNLLSSWGYHKAALSAYRLSMRLEPDLITRITALVSYAAVLVRVGVLEEAIRILEEVLEKHGEGMHPKHNSACHYNLGVAYMRLGNESRAVREFNDTIDAWPLSLYATGASAALERRRSTGRLLGEEKSESGEQRAD